MLKKLLLLLLAVNLVSCSDDDRPKPEDDKSFVEMHIDNEFFSLRKSHFIANESCEYIYATIRYYSEDDSINFRMELELTKSGHIKFIRFADYSDNNRHYETVNFKPVETFSIINFNYNPAEKTLYFEFEGELYEIGHPENKKHISGKMQHNNTTAPECGYFPHNVTTANNEMSIIDWIIYSSEVRTEYVYLTDNGYRLHIISPSNLKELDLGTYEFNSSSLSRMIIYKYIGPTQAISEEIWHDNEWETYNCEGTIEITGQHQHPKPHTTGTFTLDAFDVDGNLVFDDLSGSFEM